jgi:hypothetical protein
VPVFFGPSPPRTDNNNHAGDVAWSMGGGLIRVTDYPTNGRMGTCTIAQRAAQTARPYLGWTEDFCGAPVSFTASTPTANPAAPPTIHTTEEDMSFSLVPDAQSSKIYACSLITGNRVWVSSPYHLTLLQRYKANNAGDKMLLAELDIVASYLTRINPPAPAVTANVNVDASSVAAKVVAGVKSLIGKVTFS